MRRAFLCLCAGILLAASSAASAVAAPPAKSAQPVTFIFPDFNLGLVIFINMDRATFCTPEMTAWEEDLLAWLEGGEIGDPPVAPEEPEGFGLVSIQEKATGKGAIVTHFKGSGLAAEVWEMDADAPGIGACTDSDGALHRVGAGTARFLANDNDAGGTGTRGNAFGNRGVIDLVDEQGSSLRYSWKFHVNSRCHFTDAPACLVESSSLR